MPTCSCCALIAGRAKFRNQVAQAALPNANRHCEVPGRGAVGRSNPAPSGRCELAPQPVPLRMELTIYGCTSYRRRRSKRGTQPSETSIEFPWTSQAARSRCQPEARTNSFERSSRSSAPGSLPGRSPFTSATPRASSRTSTSLRWRNTATPLTSTGRCRCRRIAHREGLAVLIEAVTSHGPINRKRQEELRQLFAPAAGTIVFVTAFMTRRDMVKYASDIAWETEVWVAESPTHLIHFNGERFLGPY